MREYVFLRYPNFKDKAVTLSYDDGVIADKRMVEILNKYGIKCTFNISSQILNIPGRLTNEEVLEVYKGHEIAAHGQYHKALADIATPLAVLDVINGKKELEDLTSQRIIGMAYASGSFNDDVVDILDKCGIKYCRTTHSTKEFFIPNDWLRLDPTCHHNDPELMDLARQFLEEQPAYYWARHAKLFYLWGHSYEFDNDSNWEVLEEFCKYVSNRDDIWYCTNRELFDYVQSYKRLEFSANGKRVYNPTTTTVYMDYYEKKVVVKPGEEVEL